MLINNKLTLEHRQPPGDWNASKENVAIYLQNPIATAAQLAQEIFDAVVNLSIAQPPSSDTVETLIHKSKVVRDYLLDAYEMIERV